MIGRPPLPTNPPRVKVNDSERGSDGSPGREAPAVSVIMVCFNGSGFLSQALGSTPVAGMFGSCEIGPVGGRTELLTYTGVLALID